jgi:Helix-turn-helix domain
MQKHITPYDIQTFSQIIAKWPVNTASHQRERLLEAMRECGGVTTLEAMRFVDPRARVAELRRKGYRIDTSWVIQSSEAGRLHYVGLYRVTGDPITVAALHKSIAPSYRSAQQLTLAFPL